MTVRAVALIGLRGAGKTTVGRALADRLGWAFVDADDRLAAAVGRPIGAWLAEVGEAEFRRREQAVTVPLLETARETVIATGGGAVTIAAVRYALADPALLCAWLWAPDEVLVDRIRGAATTRPPLTALPLAGEVAAMRRQREGWYCLVADLAVTTTAADAGAAAATIAAAVAARDRQVGP